MPELHPRSVKLRRALGWSVWGGAALWSVLVFAPSIIPLQAGLIARILLLCFLWLMPMALLRLVSPEEPEANSPLFHALCVLQPIAALATFASFLLPVGWPAAALAALWLLFCALLALLGLLRLRRLGFQHSEEVCCNAGLLYTTIGGAWLVASRAGMQPLGFTEPIVLLTAIHFHYAGFSASVLTGFVGRAIPPSATRGRLLFWWSALGVVSGPPLVAIGFVGPSWLQFSAAILLVLGVLLVAVLTAFWVVPSLPNLLSRGLLLISALSSVVAMGFACAYALGEVMHKLLLSIPSMVLVHGITNSVGFALAGFLAWYILPASPHAR